MKELRWDLVKSGWLKRNRGASFEDIIQSELIAVKRHPGRPLQKIMLFDYGGYIWVVPFVEDTREIFLKTLYPSRKYTKLYRKGEIR